MASRAATPYCIRTPCRSPYVHAIVPYSAALAKQDGRVTRRTRGVDVLPVVVGPHHRKLQLRSVLRLQQTALELLVIELRSLVPIPVDHPGVDPVGRRQLHLARSPHRVRLVVVAP